MSPITIVLIIVAMLSLAALELWLFWRLGDRVPTRHQRRARLSETRFAARSRHFDSRSSHG